MTGLYANVIIDISHESVDKTFQYRVPEKLRGTLNEQQFIFLGAEAAGEGDMWWSSWMSRTDGQKLKEIEGIVEHSATAQSQLIWLAWWMKRPWLYLLNQCTKTVLLEAEDKGSSQTIRLLVKRGLGRRWILDERRSVQVLPVLPVKREKSRSLRSGHEPSEPDPGGP